VIARAGGESSHAAKRAEGVVEGAILLHQNHNVLGVQVSAPRLRIDSKCPLDGRQAGA
jgi:hypothetical protein